MAEIPSYQIIWRLREGGKRDKEFVLALAVLIYLRWADFQEAEQEAIASFDDTDYEPAIPASLHWRSWCYLQPTELHPFLTKQLPSSLGVLQNIRQKALATHLYRVGQSLDVFWRFNPEEVATMVKWLSEQPFETPSDRIALLEIYDDLLSATTYRWSGEYQTPSGIAHLIAKLAMPVNGERIYDPCFGSGRLLTAAYHHVLHHEKDRYNRRGGPDLRIFGVELSSRAYIIGLARLTLSGIDNPQLELGNSLERMHSDNPQRDGFDVVLANPPWGMRVSPELMKHYPVPMQAATGMFIQHALAQLRPGGRAVIVVPQGILFRGGPDQRLRSMLLDKHTVEAVIALPETAFMPHTAVRSSILILKRGGSTNRIRMVDAESFFDKGKGRQSATIDQAVAVKLALETFNPQPSEHFWDVDPNTLAEIEWDLTPRRRDQSGLIGVLDTLGAEIEVLQLEKVCQILIGRPLRHDQLVDTPPPREETPQQALLFPEQNRKLKQISLFDAPHIPYVRIKDIKRGRADKGSSWLTPVAAVSVDSKWKLKTGDVLLSKSGTIGKVGIVGNGAVGAVTANGLFILRPSQDRLDPHFLIGYLKSAECRAWLGDKARGATIQHLSKRALQELSVPLPPLQMQQRIAKEHLEHSVDVLAFLANLLTEGEKDPISEWLEKITETLPISPDAIDDPLNLVFLDRLATQVQPIRKKAAHNYYGESTLTAWILQFSESVSALRGARNIPPGPGLLSLLQESSRGLRDAISTIKGHLPNEARARKFTKLIISWLEMACSSLLNDVKLVLKTDTEVIKTDEAAEIAIEVHNRGPLPLRDLFIKTSPDWGHDKIAYLSDGTKKTIHLSGTGPKVAGPFKLTVSWSGLTLDGHNIKEDREIVLSVIESDSQIAYSQTDFGGSPYVCGDPIRPERNDVFFGREELLDQIRRQILKSGNVVLLEGNRRAGKSSILWHLEGMEAVPGWMGIYCSLQGAEGSRDGVGVPTVEVFREMAKSIAKRLHTLGGETPLPDGNLLPANKKLGIAKACRKGITSESPFSDFRDYTEGALEKLAEHDLGLLLMMDEFDKLQEGIDSGITSPQVLENIRFMVQTYPRFSAILTGSRRLKRLREEYWSVLFGLGTRFGVSYLSAEAARLLVTEPVKGKLTYSREAVEHTFFLTAGHPYLLQCLCNRVFDLAVQLKTRSVTLDVLLKASDSLVKDNEHFASLWDYAKSDRRRFILALCHKESEGPDVLGLSVIQERLLRYDIEVDDETLIADLDFLRELELIEKEDDSSGTYYFLTIPLMGFWIVKQQDFAAIKIKAKLETEDQHG